MRRTFAIVLLIAGLSTAPTSGAAAATSAAPVVLGGFTDIAVDEAHGHVFVSQGDAGGVAVTDLQGNAVATIESLAGAVDLELTPTRTSVVVALRATHEVATIDTATFAVTKWSTGSACPRTVAAAGDDVIWFASLCTDFGYGTVAALERADGTVTAVPGSSRHEVAVHSRWSVPGKVVIFDAAGEVGVYDETSVDGTPGLAEISRTSFVNGVDDVELTADGTGLAVTDGDWPRIWSVADLDVAISNEYRSDTAHHRPLLHLRADGMLLVGPEVFEPAHYERLTILDLDGELKGAEWGADRLYAVSKDRARPRLLRLRNILVRAPSQVGIQASTGRIAIGGKLRLDLTLSTRSADRQVTVRAVTAGSSTVVARPQVGPRGVSLHVEPRRNTTYVASYAGDADVAPSRSSVEVGVTAKVSLQAVDPVAVRNGIAYYRSGSLAKFAATVEAWRSGCVHFRFYIRRIRQWIFTGSTRCLDLDRRGQVLVKVRSRSGTRYYATRVVATYGANENNDTASSRWKQFQFCPGSIPCRAPVG